MATRTALAPLPNGSTRLSMAPQRKPSIAPAPPRQSLAPAPRQSLASTRQSSVGTSRQSSIGVGRKSMAPGGSKFSQDPRNVTEKGVMRNYINNIVEYLAEQQYTKQISPKMLLAPSSKDFIYILEFLYQQFDPTFKIGKPEDDVVFIFKALKYPLQISKRGLASVGAQHTWPPFLAALHWIVELLRAREYTNDPLIDDMGGSEGDDKQFFEFICKSYPSWLDGNDDMPSLEDEMDQNFEQRNRMNREEIENFLAIKEEVAVETQAIIDAGDRIEAAKRKKATLEDDIHKFSVLVDQFLSAIQGSKQRLQACEKEIETKDSELAAVLAEKARLQGIIAMQEQQSIDVSKINAKKATLTENLDSASGMKERMDAANWDDELKLSKKMDEIDKLLQQYHQVAARLQLVGPDTKNANGTNYQILFDRHSVSAENSISSDIKYTIKPACRNLLTEFADKIRAAQAEILLEKEAEKQLSENITDKQEDLKALEVKLKKLETSLQKEKEKASDDVKQIELEIERYNQEISNMRETAKIRAGKSNKSLEAAKLEQNEQIRRIEEETQSRREAILYMVDVLAKHKEWMTKHFEEMHEQLRSDYANTVKQSDIAIAEKIVRVLK